MKGPSPCRLCGGPKGRYPYGAMRIRVRYCEACAQKVREDYDRAHRLCDSTDAAHYRWSCLDCQRIKKQRQLEAAARGAATRAKNYPRWRKPEDAEKYWQGRAHAAVKAAIRHGLLPSLKGGEYACADCDGVAQEYDHRDYGKPLDVQPVCRSCNKKRGTAIWPSPDQYDFKRFGPAPAKEGEAA